ncbi:MAG: class I SAM-dependent methyltransferase [Planctomycetes bacterium]|nr:class I SAM-dependent methyltransferase [Planctomycetota bacterium]
MIRQSAAPPSEPLGWLDRLGRRMLRNHLTGLRRGELAISDPLDHARFGESQELCARLQIHRGRFYREALLGGTLAFADTYIRGDWDCDDLTNLFRISIRNMEQSDALDRGLPKLAMAAQRVLHWLRDNTRRGSRRNIHAHYDLGNEFFRLWLDETWAYSSGIFPSPDASLRSASLEKFDRACRKLDLSPDDHLLEIGTGWGGLALHAAQNYGCRVTTTTISDEQFSVARERVNAAGLDQRISLLKQDYRDLQGRFDKLVSIEMIEAVGHRNFDQYFERCGKLLADDGSLLLQAIVMPERRYKGYLRSVDFIQKYVFPGGCLPSIAAMLESAGRTTDLRLVHVEDFAPHYAETLRRWRAAFEARLDEVRALGYSEQFIRLWRYYLCYCEALFEERYVGVVHAVFDKPLCRRDPIELSRAAAVARHKVELTKPATIDGGGSVLVGN